MQKPSAGSVQVINATAPLGPVQGKAPIVYALPGLVGHRDKLREALAEAWKGRGDAVFLVPASNKTAVVWRVFWEKGLIRLIEEYEPPTHTLLLTIQISTLCGCKVSGRYWPRRRGEQGSHHIAPFRTHLPGARCEA